ncbi:hypothetical protein ACFOEY_03820 [Paracandidimonas soli]|uniref:Uncharacterized protein n=1 Tax=Paracandidimonas soli TaxID=1917182 RepID=A0A4R3VH12_9BURK|nr:hypothetical protein EV686_101575 [Paracandidimonas soli]
MTLTITKSEASEKRTAGTGTKSVCFNGKAPPLSNMPSRQAVAVKHLTLTQ